MIGVHDRRGVGTRVHRVAAGLRRQETAGVVVAGFVEHALGAALLDDLALGHDADPVGHLAHHAEVVGDQQERHVETLLEFVQKLEDLRLYGDVQCRRRFVRDQKIRFVGKRHRDHDALPLTPGEFVGIGTETLGRVGQCHHVEQLQGALAGGAFAHAPMYEEDLAELLLDGVQRIERGHRLLEHHADAFAADLQHVVLGRANHLLAVDPDRPPGMARVLVGQ